MAHGALHLDGRYSAVGRRLWPRGTVNQQRTAPHSAVVATVGHEYGPLRQVTLDGLAHFRAEGQDTLFVALARHLEFSALQVNVLHVEAHQFGAAHPCPIEQEQHEVVAPALKRVGKGRIVQQAVHLLLLQKGGQGFVGLGVAHEGGRVALCQVHAHQVAIERPQCAQSRVDGVGMESLLVLVGHPGAHHVRVDVGPRPGGILPEEEGAKGAQTRLILADGLR